MFLYCFKYSFCTNVRTEIGYEFSDAVNIFTLSQSVPLSFWIDDYFNLLFLFFKKWKKSMSWKERFLFTYIMETGLY